MEQQIFNKTITIQGVAQKETKNGAKYSLKDHEGRTFNFFTTKLDGTDTSAFAQFKNMGLKMGDTVMIGYVEDEFQMDGKTVLSKKIISFRETNDQPTQTAPQTKSFNGEAPVRSQGHSSDAFGRRLGIQGHINALLSNPSVYNSGGPEAYSIPGIVKLAIEIEDEAEKQLNPSPLRQAVTRHAPAVVEDLPVIQQNEDFTGEDIPFY